jgi:UDP-glucose 4-epimerase
MRVLITGGAGFIGSHLAESLIEAGHSVAALDDLSAGSMRNLARLADRPGFQFVRGDSRDAGAVGPLIRDCDAVVHLAAAVGVKRVVEEPVESLETNIDAARTVLRAAAEAGRKVLLASSSEVYGASDRVPFREDDPTVLGLTRQNRWSYACSKALIEFLGFAYHRERGLPVVAVRLFNTIGPRQTGRYGMVVPRFIRAALAGEPLPVHGAGRQTRCFADVSDVVAAMGRLLVEPAAVGGVFNVGGDREISIDALADIVLRITGSRSAKQYVPFDRAYGRPFEDTDRRIPDIARIRGLLGWSPTVPLEESVRRTSEHMKAEPEAAT